MMYVPLGIRLEAGLSIGTIQDVLVERLALVSGGQEVLAYLRDKDAIREFELSVRDGEFGVSIEIPVRQLPLVAHPPRGNNRRLAHLMRQDEGAMQAEYEAVAAVERSARLVQEVGELVNRHADPAPRIRALEQRDGVDSKPALRFNYHHQMDFPVEFDGGAEVAFERCEVRPAIASVDTVDVEAVLGVTVPAFCDVRARMVAVSSTENCLGLAKGGAHTFRLSQPERWEAAVLAAAEWLRLPARMIVREITSSCTLRPLPAEIDQLPDVKRLLRDVVQAFLVVLDRLDACELVPPEQPEWQQVSALREP
jgi:hypothetical protein